MMMYMCLMYKMTSQAFAKAMQKRFGAFHIQAMCAFVVVAVVMVAEQTMFAVVLTF